MDAMYEGLTSKYTIAGFNQTYITHSGDMRSPALTRLGMCRMNNKKPGLQRGDEFQIHMIDSKQYRQRIYLLTTDHYQTDPL